MASQSDARRAPSGAFGNPSIEEVAADESGEHPVGSPAGAEARKPLISGAFPSTGARGEDSPFAALAPYHDATRSESEHAVLDIPDPIIGQQTAFSASSLVPPPRKPFPLGRAVAGLAVLALGATAGALLPARSPAAQPVQVAAVVAPVAPRSGAEPAAAVVVAVPDELPMPTPPTPERAEPASPDEAPAVAVSPQREVTRRELPQPRRAAAPAQRDLPDARSPASEPEAPEAIDVSALTLPTTPTREQIAAGLNALIPQLKECAAGVQGLATAKVTIAASGAVRYAVVGGSFQGTPAGSCMALALRGATFPEFARESISVEYPFSL